jgi:hypothetical protein
MFALVYQLYAIVKLDIVHHGELDRLRALVEGWRAQKWAARAAERIALRAAAASRRLDRAGDARYCLLMRW